jgi:hypothetical protein
MEIFFCKGSESNGRDIAFGNGLHDLFRVLAYGMNNDEQWIGNVLDEFAIGKMLLVLSIIPLDSASLATRRLSFTHIIMPENVSIL